MTNICKRLHAAKTDEANGVLEYVKLRDLFGSDHREHIETIENIIMDENRHLEEILVILQEMKCPELTINEVICMSCQTIYDEANKIEKLSGHINGEDGKKIKQIAETIEKGMKEIKAIVKNK